MHVYPQKHEKRTNCTIYLCKSLRYPTGEPQMQQQYPIQSFMSVRIGSFEQRTIEFHALQHTAVLYVNFMYICKMYVLNAIWCWSRVWGESAATQCTDSFVSCSISFSRGVSQLLAYLPIPLHPVLRYFAWCSQALCNILVMTITIAFKLLLGKKYWCNLFYTAYLWRTDLIQIFLDAKGTFPCITRY